MLTSFQFTDNLSSATILMFLVPINYFKSGRVTLKTNVASVGKSVFYQSLLQRLTALEN